MNRDRISAQANWQRMIQAVPPGSPPLAFSILDNLADAVLLTTESGELQFVNASVETLLGYSVQQVYQMGHIRHLLGSDLFSPQELAQRGELRNLMIETVDQAGQLRSLVVHIKHLVGIQYPEPLVLYTCCDCTEQAQAQAQLQRQQRQFTALLSAISEAVLIVNEQGYCIETNSAASQILGYSRAHLLSCPLADLLEHGSTPVALSWLLEQHHLEQDFYLRGRDGIRLPITCILLPNYFPRHHLLVLREKRDRTSGEAQLQQLNYLLENRVQQRTLELQQAHQQESLIRKVTERIHHSLQLEDILNTTVAEVKELFNCDRVLAYCLDPTAGGRIVAEAVGQNWQSVIGREINDCYFNDIYADLYRQGRVHAVTDLYTAKLTPCHVQLLEQLQVRANLAIPIVAEEKLWGLLVVQQCRSVREWQPLEIQLLQQLATQVAIAIYQSQLYEQVQTELAERQRVEAKLRRQAIRVKQLNLQLERRVKARTAELQLAYEFEATLKRITDKVRQSLDEDQIIQTAVQELTKVLGAKVCNASLYDLEQRLAYVRYEHTTLPGPYLGRTLAMDNAPAIYNQLLQGRAFPFCSLNSNSDRGRVALLTCPILDSQTVMGDLWIASRVGHAFTEQDIHLVQQVANQCGIALRQSNLYRAAQAQVTELERLNQLKDDFLSTVSHELRTPMANIRMATEMLEILLQETSSCEKVGNRGCDRIPNYLAMLKGECQREARLIDDLLDLCRLDAEVEPLSLIEIQPAMWLRHIAEPFEVQTQQQQQQFQFDLPESLPTIVIDLSYLERIIGELLQNACKYTPAGETITLAAHADPDAAMLNIEIINTGISISPTEQAHIFEKFYRIPNSDPWKHGGTGLGLALVQKLVAALGGTIHVTSQPTATCFQVKLPLNSSTPT